MALDQVTARDRAIGLLTKLLDIEERGQVRHESVAEVVDALIDAARAPESAHTRAVLAGEITYYDQAADAALRAVDDHAKDRDR